MAAFGLGPVIAATVGIILLGLLRTPLRWTGAAALLLAVVWALAVPQPDVLVSGDGHNVGVRGKDGRLHLMRTAKDGFLLKEWLAADADGRQPTDASLAEGVSCDEAGCVTQMADGAFVGGSLVSAGGHNILEPAAFGKIPVFGPSMENFAEIAARFVAAGAAVQVESPEDVGVAWIELFRDPQRMKEMGATARRLVGDSRGATDRAMAELAKQMDGAVR